MFAAAQQILGLLALASLAGFQGSKSWAVMGQEINPSNFTIINGQIFTPGLAIVDAPQPNTPEGGDFLQVALDVSHDGAIGLPPYSQNAAAKIFNITIFLFSFDTGRNFTISNGTASANNASLGDIMAQEPGSTVKHVNWVWPSCLVGNGPPDNNSSARGTYNISIHQSFELNETNYYTVFDLPIEVTNSIPANNSRPSCDSLNNKLLPADQVNATGPAVVLPGSVPTGSSTTGSTPLGSSAPKSTSAAILLRPQLSTSLLSSLVFASIFVIYLGLI